MKFLRLMLAVLLSVAVPLVAAARVAAPDAGPACPMQHPAHAVGMAAVAAMAGHACCGDAPGHAHLHQPCKSGQACKACSVFSALPVAVGDLPEPTAVHRVVVALHSVVPSRAPRGLWRPPRAL